MKIPEKPLKADIAWHALGTEDVFARLGSGAFGLEAAECERRLREFGPNRLTPPKRRSALLRFLAQFHNVLIYVLICVASLTAFLRHWVDFGVIVGVVFINALIGVIQEGKAESALEAIKNMLSHKATVLRGGRRLTVLAEDLVPGDVVLLQSGDKVPADLRLFKVKNLRADEAVLTGESAPVEKSSEPSDAAAVIGDRTSMAFSGTVITYGQAAGLAVSTGDSTEIGRISSMLGTVRPLTTRLLVEMAAFGRLLTAAIIVIALITFAFGIFVRDFSVGQMFLAAVGISVAAIPEGLPAILTITLAIGVERMAKRNAIIRRLPAVETLGSVTVICTDKTGTLTKNEMTVKTVLTDFHKFEVGGVGYDPHGGFSLDGKEVSAGDMPEIAEIGRAAILCNDASVHNFEGRWLIQGDPTEGALITLGMKAAMEPLGENEKFPRIDTIPFESEHRFMATLHHDHADHYFIYLKGAPERVLELSSRQMRGGRDVPIEHSLWLDRINTVADRGQRMIAVALKAVEGRKLNIGFSDVESGGFTLLGILGMIDPPSMEAVEAVKKCRSAHIKVKMITGDHVLTARSIGAEMGIGDGESAITGVELQRMTDAELKAAVNDVDVFARVNPEHKLRIVEALQANGEVAAMTGDGVNDAPALKRADVGIAMGIKGTEVSKEAAGMVLTDDNFASIAHAVQEGRTAYDNIKKAIAFILPTNGGEAGTIIAAIISAQTLPVTPLQILWVNMITAVTLALALAFEPSETDIMKRPPRSPKEPLLSGFLIWRIIFVSGVIMAGTFGLFLWERLHGAEVEKARTVAVNTIIMFEVFYLLNTRHLTASVLSKEGLFGNRYVLLAIGVVLAVQLAFTYAHPMQYLFGTAPIGLSDWLKITAVASSVFVFVEFEKLMLRKNVLKMRPI